MIARDVRLPHGASIRMEMDADGLQAALRQRLERASDLRPLLRVLARRMREAAGRAFADGGPGWKPLADNTVAAKMAAGLPALSKRGKPLRRLMQQGQYGGENSILIRTGALRDSWRQMGARGHVETMDPAAGTVTVGSQLRDAKTGAPIALFMQYGTRGPYTIRPNKAAVLRFMTVGGPAIARSVRHPGVAARPVVFDQTVIDELQGITDAYLRGEDIGG